MPTPGTADDLDPESLLEAIPAAVYVCDTSGKIVSYNKRAAQLWGREPRLGSDRFCGSLRLISPDGKRVPHEVCPMAKAIETGCSVRDGEIIMERPDGSRITACVNIQPLFDRKGNRAGAINCFLDISERKRIADALRASVELNRRIFASTRDCIKLLDLDGRLLSINECGLRYVGLSDPAEIIGTSYIDFWRGEDRDDAVAALEAARNGRGGRFEGFYKTPSGEDTWWEEEIDPVLDADGRPERLVVVSRNITERRRGEEHAALLAREVDHRAKNMLAVVQAMVHMMKGSSVEAYAQALQGRIAALSRAHDLLASGRWAAARLNALAQQEIDAFDTGRKRTLISGPDLLLSPRVAQALAMVLHELATNATKHGALSVRDGRLVLKWATGNDGGLQLQWTESGGPPIAAPPRHNFGTVLIEKVVRMQLGGSVAFAWPPEGLRCDVHIPWEHLAPPEHAPLDVAQEDPVGGAEPGCNSRKE